MSEVGALIIRLQAETAQFREDMGRVKKDLNGLKDTTGDVGKGMQSSMYEARGGLMLVEESLGFRLPRHLNNLIATIPGVGQAFAMMLPIAGVIVAIEIIGKLIDKHRQMKDEAEQLAQAQNNLGGTIGTVMSGLEQKFLTAGIKADELRKNHLAALHKQLQLIALTSMAELAQQFDILAGAADKAFAQMKAHWYEMGDGSEGAKHSLADFQSQYELLLKTADGHNGNADKANKLLDDKIEREEKILALQKQAAANQMVTGGQQGNYAKYEEAIVQLRQLGVGITAKEIQSEQDLVDILRAQVNVRALANKTAGLNQNNATTEYMDKIKTVYEEWVKFQESALEKQNSLGLEGLALGEKIAKEKADADIKAQQKTLSETRLSQAKSDGEKEISAGKQLNSLDKQHALGLVSEREYLSQLSQIYRAEHDAKMASLQTQMDETADPGKKIGIQQKMTEEQKKFNSEIGKTETATQKLNSSWGDYFARMKSETLDLSTTIRTSLQQSITQFTNSFAHSVAQSIVEFRGLGQATRQIAVQIAESWLEMAIKRMITDRLVTASHIAGNVTQVASDKTAGAMSQLAAAKAGAAKAYQAMAGIPIVGPELGAVAAVAAFSFMMAFEKGGKIPGAGAVPILGHGGETVVTKSLTDRVEKAEARGGSGNQSIQMHAHFAPTIHAIDASGVEGMLKKHADVFHREMRSTLRKMNR